MQPHRIKVGASCVMVSVDGIAADWGISLKAVMNMVQKWGLPLLTPEPEGKRYVSLYALESALFEATLPGAFRGDTELVRSHQTVAGLIYSSATREVIRERCMQLASQLKKGPKRIHQKDRKYPNRKKSP